MDFHYSQVQACLNCEGRRSSRQNLRYFIQETMAPQIIPPHTPSSSLSALQSRPASSSFGSSDVNQYLRLSRGVLIYKHSSFKQDGTSFLGLDAKSAESVKMKRKSEEATDGRSKLF